MDEIDPKLVERMMRCERMDPKKGKNIASERDGGSHRRRENRDRARREWLMRESWQGNEKEEGGLCWALVKMPIQFPVIPGFPWNVKLNELSEFNRRKECNEGCWEKDKSYCMDCCNCKWSEKSSDDYGTLTKLPLKLLFLGGSLRVWFHLKEILQF